MWFFDSTWENWRTCLVVNLLIGMLQPVSGMPPPSAVMAVGQFFNPEEATHSLSASRLLSSLYKQQVSASLCAPTNLGTESVFTSLCLQNLFTFVSLEVEARGSCTSSHVFISWSFFGSWITFFLILVGWAWQHVWLWEYHPMVWNLSVALSLSSVPLVLDVKTSTCGIPQTALAKEHPEPEDLLSEPFCLKCTKAIPDWYQLFAFSISSYGQQHWKWCRLWG